MLLFAVVTVALAAPIEDHGWLPVVVGSRLANTGVALLLLVVARRSTSSRVDVLMEPSEPFDRVSLGLVIVTGVFDIAAFAVYAVGPGGGAHVAGRPRELVRARDRGRLRGLAAGRAAAPDAVAGPRAARRGRRGAGRGGVVTSPPGSGRFLLAAIEHLF